MKLDHISKIKGNVSLTSNLKTSNVLDGAYKSIFKGKSLNFEELREYNIGDNIKDIDWRASARSMNILVRSHVAEKKHNIVFILDSKYDMNANANKNDLKRDICINTVGTIAYLAYQNGDYTAAIYMKDNQPVFFPLKQTIFHVENYLSYYDETLKNQKIKKRRKTEGQINDTFKYLANYLTKKAIIFIVTDMEGYDKINEEGLKLLSYRNDIMAIQINDISLYDSKSYDIDNRKYFSPVFSKNKKLSRIDKEIKEQLFIDNSNKLKKYRIPLVSIDNISDVVPKIVELLKTHNEMIYK